MNIAELWTLQCMMFFLVAFGVVLKKKGILKEESRGIITDLVLYGFLPCNIINSFRMEFSIDILKRFALILCISLLTQAVSYLLFHFFPAQTFTLHTYQVLRVLCQTLEKKRLYKRCPVYTSNRE